MKHKGIIIGGSIVFVLFFVVPAAIAIPYALKQSAAAEQALGKAKDKVRQGDLAGAESEMQPFYHKGASLDVDTFYDQIKVARSEQEMVLYVGGLSDQEYQDFAAKKVTPTKQRFTDPDLDLCFRKAVGEHAADAAVWRERGKAYLAEQAAKEAKAKREAEERTAKAKREAEERTASAKKDDDEPAQATSKRDESTSSDRPSSVKEYRAGFETGKKLVPRHLRWECSTVGTHS